MQTQAAAIVAIIATAIVVITRHAFNCFTHNQVVKTSLQDSDSAHRAKILAQVAVLLRDLPKDTWRGK